jgi:succinate dehydrogenase / fumarate reductase cytochrome b subunit
MKPCERLKSTSIAKKQFVALTGLALVGFLCTHLAGNFLMFKGKEAFDSYASFLSHHPLIIPAEIGLAAVFLAHIVWGLWVTLDNVRARPSRYEVDGSTEHRSWGARTMRYTGSMTLIFLVVHITTFKFWGPGTGEGSLWEWVVFNFQHPLYMGFYLLAMVALGTHLGHGIKSAFQTLGVSHPRYTPLIEKAGFAMALALAAGFGSIPVWAFVRGG